ncbi:tetratricopeptide repeat protein [Magnetococcus sp. PR-3]|uniref:tetratricopeptide repeat protein n=1 Tax=Magnetococcus sp. PR-3 TaxID=3120355 RepID=UPI002FCE0BB4
MGGAKPVFAESTLLKGDRIVLDGAVSKKKGAVQKLYKNALKSSKNQEKAASFMRLGHLAWHGVGQKLNTTKALEYWQKAYQLGRWDAAYLIGKHFHRPPIKQTPDLERAHVWYERAARGGHGLAMYTLWLLDRERQGGMAGSAKQWLIQSGKAGEPLAISKLSSMADMAYDGKIGGKSAVEWLILGASVGDPLSRMALIARPERDNLPSRVVLESWAEEAVRLGEWGAVALRDRFRQSPPTLEPKPTKKEDPNRMTRAQLEAALANNSKAQQKKRVKEADTSVSRVNKPPMATLPKTPLNDVVKSSAPKKIEPNVAVEDVQSTVVTTAQPAAPTLKPKVSVKPPQQASVTPTPKLVTVDGKSYEGLSWAQLMRLARRGDAEAQFRLGQSLRDESTSARSIDDGFKWLKKSAKQGHVQAQNSLGYMYSQGIGTRVDFRKALKWYGEAAKRGDALAQFNVGHMHFRGKGVKANAGSAYGWYVSSAKQGFAPAQTAVGYLLENGLGIDKSSEQSMKWYTRAARQGYGAAHNAIGRFLIGRDANNMESRRRAIMHFRLGAWEGDDVARINYDASIKGMSRAQLARIDALAKVWRDQ